jgi:4-amino-4-deoxy-L-arabinose transferase-like glycosyltransferase
VRTAATFAAVAVLYLGVGVFDHEIWSPTEPTVAGIVWNMVAHGDLAVPRINDIPYLEKPPLYYWLAVGASRLGGGLSAGTLRLPAAILGMMSLSLIYALARRRHGELIACVTLLLAASCGAFYELAHRASTDVAATFFAFLCFASYARTLPATDASRQIPSRGWDLFFALALACSFYAKNFFTFLVVLPPVLAHLCSERRFRRALVLCAWTGLFTVVLVLPWVIALQRAGGNEYLRVVFFDNTFGRFFTLDGIAGVAPGPLNNALTAEKEGSPFYYLVRLPVLTLPWILAVGAACFELARRGRPLGSYRRFLALGVVLVPLALTFSSSKVSEYLMPAFFFVPLIFAEYLGSRCAGLPRAGPWPRRLLLANLALVGAAAALGPAVLAVVRAQGLLLLLLLPSLAAAGALAWMYRRHGFDLVWLHRCLVGIAVAGAVSVGLAIPVIDAHKSYAPFFAEVRRVGEGRSYVTSFLGDHRLPLITFYLERRMRVLGVDAVIDVLRGPEPVVALIHAQDYQRLADQIAAIPGIRVGALRGGNRIVYLVNRAGGARGNPDAAPSAG